MADSLCAAQRARWAANQKAAHSCLWPGFFVLRWLTGTWAECSVSCGEGFGSRQVTCKHTRTNGMVQALPPRVCIPRDRPLGRRPCSRHPCVQGLVEQGNQ
ncbi:hypothetical protein FD755_004147, partial [Muntiacus reevesi]